jgi:hypothetical protein
MAPNESSEPNAASWDTKSGDFAHINLSDSELQDMFGPQWLIIVSMGKRNKSMTPIEAALMSTHIQTIANARDYAWLADRNDAESSGRKPIWEVIESFFHRSRGSRDAAWAVATRHLIGRDGYTQAHYDLLTQHWSTVIGKAHPDDEDRRG